VSEHGTDILTWSERQAEKVDYRKQTDNLKGNDDATRA
jgi:hypothetical protein